MDLLLQEVNSYKIRCKKFEKALLAEEAQMKAMTQSLVHLERRVNILKTEKSLLMKTSKELLTFLLQMTTSGDRITDMFPKIFRSCSYHLPLMMRRKLRSTAVGKFLSWCRSFRC